MKLERGERSRAMVVLPVPGRSPQDHRMGAPSRDHPADGTIRTEQMVLSYHLGQALGPEPIGQGTRCVLGQAARFEQIAHRSGYSTPPRRRVSSASAALTQRSPGLLPTRPRTGRVFCRRDRSQDPSDVAPSSARLRSPTRLMDRAVHASHDIARLEAVIAGIGLRIDRDDRHALGQQVHLQIDRRGGGKILHLGAGQRIASRNRGCLARRVFGRQRQASHSRRARSCPPRRAA